MAWSTAPGCSSPAEDEVDVTLEELSPGEDSVTFEETVAPEDVCTPWCMGRECGSDGCGGNCGECAGGFSCTANGLCVNGDCKGEAYFIAGELKTAGGDIAFDRVEVKMFHGPPDAQPPGCVARVTLTLGIGKGCTLVAKTGELGTATGGIGLAELTFDLDEYCPEAFAALAGEYENTGGLTQAEVVILAPVLSEGGDQCFASSLALYLAGELSALTAPTALEILVSAITVSGNFESIETADLPCPCAPECDGLECGNDGCNGSCGQCTGEEECVDGLCEEYLCEPQCEGLECGDNGCQGSCGECAEDEECIEGICQCLPDCTDLACGDDGCDGSCGECDPALELCDEGSCVCAFAPCNALCCAGGQVCYENACCQPVCDGLECGDDGCGGSCGECAGSKDECIDGLCICQPDCDNKECGSDGCSGSCGNCLDPLEVCIEGDCIIPPPLGKPCTANAQCGAGGSCLLGFCTFVCKDEGEPVDGLCDTVHPDSAWGNLFACPSDVDYCMPGAVEEALLICTTDGDCLVQGLDDYVCAGALSGGALEAEGRCVPALDRLPAGAACQDDGNCATLLCLHPGMDPAQDGSCGSWCQGDFECPEGALCTMVPATLNSQDSYALQCMPYEGSLKECTSTGDCKVGKEYCGAVISPNDYQPLYRCMESGNPQGLWLGGACEDASDCFGPYCLFETWSANIPAYCTQPCETDGDCSPGTSCRPAHHAPFEGIMPDAPFELNICLKVGEGVPCFVQEEANCEFEWSVCEPIPGGVGWLGICFSGTCPPDCDGKSCMQDDGCGAPCLGACLADGEVCAKASQCLSQECADGVCCNSPCDGECESCALLETQGICSPNPPGEDPDAECGPCTRCNGAGTCTALPPGPEPLGLCGPCRVCAKEGECAFAAAGTDEQNDCGVCELCDGEGGCTPVALGEDPKEGCEATPSEECQTTGICDGEGACEFWPDDTICGEPACEEGVRTPSPLCDGAGDCVPQEPVSCEPYLCVPDEPLCLEACTVSTQCIDDTWCQEGECQAVPDCPMAMKLLCNTTVPVNTGNMQNNWSAYEACVPGVPYEGAERIYFVQVNQETIVTMTVEDQEFDVALVLLEAACSPEYACKELVDLGPQGSPETLTFNAMPDSQYYLALDGLLAEDKGQMMVKTDCCTRTCSGENPCGSDGCGGSCGQCGEGQLCHSGQCKICAEDPGGEPNDICQEAVLVEEGEFPGGLVCPAIDEDWYAIELVEGDQLLVLVEFDSFDANLNLSLVGPDCLTVLTEAEEADDLASVEYQVLVSGTYFVRVYSPDGGQAGYDITLGILSAECLTDEECVPGKVCGFYECVAPPGACPTEADLSCGLAVDGDTTGLDNSLNDYPLCLGMTLPGPEEAHTMTVDEVTVITFSLSGLPAGGALAVLEEQCASQWACLAAALGAPDAPAVLEVKMVPGVQYFVVIDGQTEDDAGAYNLQVTGCCSSVCDGLECGDDGCGMDCGPCAGLQDACMEGLCVCQPDCLDKVCGGDGCGGSCGDCPGPQDACIEGACECQPDCLDKLCGDDGCGESCGECEGEQQGCVEGKCQCIPACDVLECGDDGCGGWCGDCEGPQDLCDEGVCVCQPDCLGRICGDDGCGGSCGECPGPQDACLAGFCVCQPDCDGKVCGSDGCVDSCGQCAPGMDCQDGQCACVADPHEANNSCGAAKGIGPGTYDVAICPAGDEDWYTIQLSAGQTLTAQVTFTHDDGDLDLFLYNQNDCAVYKVKSTSSNDMETVSISAPGTYVLRVVEFSGQQENSYSLTVNIE